MKIIAPGLLSRKGCPAGWMVLAGLPSTPVNSAPVVLAQRA